MNEIERKVLVPIGLETKAEDVLKLILFLKNAEKYLYVLFTAVKLPPTTSLESEEQLIKLDATKKLKRRINEVGKEMGKYGLKTEARIVACREVYEAIVEESNQGYELIILVKRKRVKPFFEKSISRKVIEKTNIPVLLLRSE